MSATPSAFPELVRWYRQRAGLSQNRLARTTGIDPAYVNRIEGSRAADPLVPRPAILGRLCGALELTTVEADRLYFAARRCPPTLAAVGMWDPAIAALAELL